MVKLSNATGQTLPVVLLLLIVVGSREAHADPLYSITGLGMLPGTSESAAMAINASGQVVGISYNSADGSFANSAFSAAGPTFNQTSDGGQSFLYSGGQLTQINPTGGLATAINANGNFVGGSYSSINDAGQYVGSPFVGINSPNPLNQAVLVNGGTTTNLPMDLAGINNAGEIAGFISVPKGGGTNTHAAIYQAGQVQDIDSLLPTDKGYFDTRAIALNQNGDLLIKAGSTTATDTYLYNSGTHLLTSLSTLPGAAGFFGAALNGKDQVVGNGFLFSNGSIVPLTSLLPTANDWSGLNALGINDAGQIVGQGLHNGAEEAFLMAPLAQSIPEPAAIAVWGVLALVLARRVGAERFPKSR